MLIRGENGLKLNISDSDKSQDLGLVKEVAEFFRIHGRDADRIITEVASAVKSWRAVAKKYNISNSEQERMAPAFRV